MADLEQSTQVVDEHATTTSRDDKDDLSDASYLSDVEEVDHMKTGTAVDELMFDDSYFRQEKPVDVCDDAEESQLLDSAVSNPWERIADWIHCFCVVTFDLEIGQMIEVNLLMIFFVGQIYLNLICYCFIAGSLPKSCPSFRTGQDQSLLLGLSRFQFWMHGIISN